MHLVDIASMIYHGAIQAKSEPTLRKISGLIVGNIVHKTTFTKFITFFSVHVCLKKMYPLSFLEYLGYYHIFVNIIHVHTPKRDIKMHIV